MPRSQEIAGPICNPNQLESPSSRDQNLASAETLCNPDPSRLMSAVSIALEMLTTPEFLSLKVVLGARLEESEASSVVADREHPIVQTVLRDSLPLLPQYVCRERSLYSLVNGSQKKQQMLAPFLNKSPDETFPCSGIYACIQQRNL